MSAVLIISDKKWASLPVLVEVESRFLDELAIIIQMCQTSLKTLCEWLRYKDLHLACYCDLIIPSVCPVFTYLLVLFRVRLPITRSSAPAHPLWGTMRLKLLFAPSPKRTRKTVNELGFVTSYLTCGNIRTLYWSLT